MNSRETKESESNILDSKDNDKIINNLEKNTNLKKEKNIISNKKDDENKKLRRNFIVGFLVSFFVIGIVCVIVFLIEYFVTRSGGNIYVTLCDTFLVPSLLAILVYVLNILTKEGAFDAIVYGVKLAFYNTFYSNIRKTKLPASYSEYRELKRGQKRTNIMYIVLASIPYIIVGLAYYILYAVSI